MYKYTQLVRHIDKGIIRIDDPLLNRAWEIVKECIQAHVIVDREEGQTVRLARAEAWKEWVDAYQGEEETTCTFAGMVAEMIIACPDEEELDNLVAEAHALAQGKPLKPKPTPPKLILVIDNSHNHHRTDR